MVVLGVRLAHLVRLGLGLGIEEYTVVYADPPLLPALLPVEARPGPLGEPPAVIVDELRMVVGG